MKKKIVLCENMFLIVLMFFSLCACGQGSENKSVQIKYNKKSFYFGAAKNEVEKVLGKPVSEGSEGDDTKCVYIDDSEPVIVNYDKEGKSNKVEILSGQVTVNGLKTGDTCDKVVAMFPKYEYQYKYRYDQEAKLKIESIDGAQGYNIYMRNNQNIDKELYDESKGNSTELYYWIKIPYTPENMIGDENRQVAEFIVGK